jgi:hypothetical protein
MYKPTSILKERARQPLTPEDLVRAVVTADDGLYEAIVTVHGGSCLHAAGVWRLARYSRWSPPAAAPARALRDLLAPVTHPLAGLAIVALDEGIAVAEGAARSVPTCA